LLGPVRPQNGHGVFVVSITGRPRPPGWRREPSRHPTQDRRRRRR